MLHKCLLGKCYEKIGSNLNSTESPARHYLVIYDSMLTTLKNSSVINEGFSKEAKNELQSS